jgi:hypothetical protein
VLRATPVSLCDCHCIDCRRSAGAPYITWGSVRVTDLQVTRGTARTVEHAGRLRSFASCCGTHLFFQDGPGAEWIDVTIASLDEPGPFGPEKSIWIEDRLPWVVLEPHRPAYPQRSPPTA